MLVYDGDSAFCTSSAAWIRRRLPPGTPVDPWQSVDLDALGLTLDDVTTAAWWVADDGRFRGHEAIGKSLVVAGGVWGLIGRLILHPPVSWIARPVYALVARYRHRLPGSTDACKLDR